MCIIFVECAQARFKENLPIASNYLVPCEIPNLFSLTVSVHVCEEQDRCVSQISLLLKQNLLRTSNKVSITAPVANSVGGFRFLIDVCTRKSQEHKRSKSENIQFITKISGIYIVNLSHLACHNSSRTCIHSTGTCELF